MKRCIISWFFNTDSPDSLEIIYLHINIINLYSYCHWRFDHWLIINLTTQTTYYIYEYLSYFIDFFSVDWFEYKIEEYVLWLFICCYISPFWVGPIWFCTCQKYVLFCKHFRTKYTILNYLYLRIKFRINNHVLHMYSIIFIAIFLFLFFGRRVISL